MQYECIPEHDDQGSILLRAPAPESAPRIIGPQATQDSADKAEEQCETEATIDHAHHRSTSLRIYIARQQTAQNVDHCNKSSDEGRSISERHRDNMRR